MHAKKAQETPKHAAKLSKDEQWRSFPKVPCLLQYVSTRIYYARVRANGKLIRRSLKTDVWSTAKLRLADFISQQTDPNSEPLRPMKVAEALALYEHELGHNTSIKPQSKQYRKWCILKIKTSWPGLLELDLAEVTEKDCREWAAQVSRQIASHYFNNTIATLRLILAAGIKAHVEAGGTPLANPAEALARVRVKQKELRLPERDQFHALIQNIRKHSGGWGPRIADAAEFLAFSGMRIFSEAQWVTWEDIDWTRREMIVRGDPETATKNSEVRRVPILPDMEKLLTRMKAGAELKDKILEVHRFDEALRRACVDLGLAHLSHHDLRHLFATRCIESGVDIPTVSRWLGHKDGGALAMRTYGHLRNEQIQAMAQKVRF